MIHSSGFEIDSLKFDDRGLIPCVIQDAQSKRVLMVAWMNRESLQLTLETRQTHFWSRSRGALWHKGASSGNTQSVISIEVDCDRDVLLAQVVPVGPACHNGTDSCFDTDKLELERP